jgi:hypothetical protein
MSAEKPDKKSEPGKAARPSRRPEGTDLVRRAETAPAAAGGGVTVPREIVERHFREYREKVARSRKDIEKEVKAAAATQYWSYGLGAAAIVVGSGVTLPFAALLALGGLVSGMDARASLDKANRAAIDRAHELHSRLRAEFIQAQRAAYNEKQDSLVRLADAYLEQGGLLDETALAYLAAVEPRRLRQASDQLAISVLQVRGMLAHVRCRSIDLDGNRYTPKPARFADLKLSGRVPEHRPILRQKLEEQGRRLVEDAEPHFKDPEFSVPGEGRQNRRQRLARFFGAPFHLRADRARTIIEKMPELPPVEPPPLKSVANIASIIEAYEKANGRLDLPAMRGWGRDTRALPGMKPLL